jgi:hypothetical protein
MSAARRRQRSRPWPSRLRTPAGWSKRTPKPGSDTPRPSKPSGKQCAFHWPVHVGKPKPPRGRRPVTSSVPAPQTPIKRMGSGKTTPTEPHGHRALRRASPATRARRPKTVPSSTRGCGPRRSGYPQWPNRVATGHGAQRPHNDPELAAPWPESLLSGPPAVRGTRFAIALADTNPLGGTIGVDPASGPGVTIVLFFQCIVIPGE